MSENTNTSTHTHKLSKGYAVAAVAAIGVVLSIGSATASVNATAANVGQATASDVVSLVMTSNGAGLDQPVAKMLPGDVVNRHIALTNGPSNTRNLRLGVTGTGATALTTDATKGLRVTLNSCTVAFTPATGACAGTPGVLMTSTAVSTLGTAVVLAPSVNAAEVRYIQVQLSLPDSVETTVNGVAPTGTIQNLSTTLTYTFTEDQRAATTTNS